MEHSPRPSTSPVYHGTDPEMAFRDHVVDGAADLPDGAVAEVSDNGPVTVVPRLFGLCITGPAEPHADDATIFDVDEVIAWGLAYADEAVVYMRDPDTGRRDLGVFVSAGRARKCYSRFGPLRLVYP